MPWAAKRVRRRSSGYAVVVAMPPAVAPEMNDSTGCGSRGERDESACVVVRYAVN